jgi:hypothetical protein
MESVLETQLLAQWVGSSRVCRQIVLKIVDKDWGRPIVNPYIVFVIQ